MVISRGSDDQPRAWLLTIKSSSAKIASIVFDLARSRDAADIQRQIILQRGGEIFLQEDVADGHSAARSEQSRNLVERQLFLCLGHEVDHAVADDAVCRVVAQG